MDRDTDNSQEKCSGGGQGCRNGDRGQIFIVCVRHNHHGDDLFIANMMTRLRDAMRCRVDARSSHQAGSEMTTPRCAEFESLKEEQRRPRPRKEEQLEEGMCINRVIWSEGSTRALFSPPLHPSSSFTPLLFYQSPDKAAGLLPPPPPAPASPPPPPARRRQDLKMVPQCFTACLHICLSQPCRDLARRSYSLAHIVILAYILKNPQI